MKNYAIVGILLFLFGGIFFCTMSVNSTTNKKSNNTVVQEIKYDTITMEQAIQKQLKRYPKSTLGDIYKNFYQDRFGSEHLVKDTQMVYDYISNELQNMDTTYCELVEEIGWEHNCVRISLELIKKNQINEQMLALAFIQTANSPSLFDTGENWLKEWKIITSICEKYKNQIKDFEVDKKNIDSILSINPKAAIRHSKDYNIAYKPHYRIVKKEYLQKIGIDKKND